MLTAFEKETQLEMIQEARVDQSVVVEARESGFAVPTDPWLRGRLRGFVADILFDERTRRRPYFNHAYIEQLFAAHQSGHRMYSDQLWLLLNFELWHRQFLDTAPGAP